MLCQVTLVIKDSRTPAGEHGHLPLNFHRSKRQPDLRLKWPFSVSSLLAFNRCCLKYAGSHYRPLSSYCLPEAIPTQPFSQGSDCSATRRHYLSALRGNNTGRSEHDLRHAHPAPRGGGKVRQVSSKVSGHPRSDQGHGPIPFRRRRSGLHPAATATGRPVQYPPAWRQDHSPGIACS
jgi:hypothetical protein